jgi:oligoribonuclease NrnB/cAMP/cGMP phosphodiesterase (DHH superfamily)
MICFFHGSDLDGRCSGAIWHRSNPGSIMIPSAYHRKVNLDSIRDNEHVVFLDFFLDSEEEVDKLYAITPNVTIIDHHNRTCIGNKKYNGIIDPDNDLGACAMTWQFLNKEPMPDIVKAIAEFDVWDRKYANVRICEALLLHNTNHKSYIWKKIFANDKSLYNNLISSGDIIVTYKRKWSTRYVKAYSFPCKVMGHDALFVNLGLSTSDIFDGVDTSRYKILLRGTFTPERIWKISITSDHDTIDVGEIAAKFNGGGRSNTAGCVVKDLEELIEFVDITDRWKSIPYSNEIYSSIDSK